MVQIEQALQIGTKLLQIGAAPVVTNQSNIYYKLKQNYYKLGQLLQIAAELLGNLIYTLYDGNVNANGNLHATLCMIFRKERFISKV